MGCAPHVAPLEQRLSDKFRPDIVDVGGWELMVVRKGAGPVRRIYIEGDGRAYISRGQPSGDPTPVQAVGLELFKADEGAAVYLGRPCQWVRGPQCADRLLWTEGRFTEDVARRYAALVAREGGGNPVELVGYSGGAWVALQAAARLETVSRVVTVAGNLMPDWVNGQHKVTRIAVAGYPGDRLKALPVVAYVGKRDRIVAPGVVGAYKQAVGAEHVTVVEVDATHGEGWDQLKMGD